MQLAGFFLEGWLKGCVLVLLAWMLLLCRMLLASFVGREVRARFPFDRNCKTRKKCPPSLNECSYVVVECRLAGPGFVMNLVARCCWLPVSKMGADCARQGRLGHAFVLDR